MLFSNPNKGNIMLNVIGLFGTCANSTWREAIVQPILEKAGVEYFNPVVADWNEESQKNEVLHAAEDKVVLMAITGETCAIASMAELGWQAYLCSKNNRKIVLYIEDMPNDVCDEFGTSLRINKVRALVRRYAEKAVNVVLVNSLEEAANKAVELYK
jgi:hypothetical protein